MEYILVIFFNHIYHVYLIFSPTTKTEIFCSFQSGSSPLLVASYKGNVEVVRTLLKYHARVDVFDEVFTVTIANLLVFSAKFISIEAELALAYPVFFFLFPVRPCCFTRVR